MRLSTQNRIVAALASIAVAGIVLEAASGTVRRWLNDRPLTSGILVGGLLIGATYLVVERALAERERDRWSQAAASLLRAIADAGAATDAELRGAQLTAQPGRALAQAGWLMQMLDGNQAALSATPELMARWHAARSLAQHAKAALSRRPPVTDEAYETAWERFCIAFGDVHDFTRDARYDGMTWAAMPTVAGPEEAP